MKLAHSFLAPALLPLLAALGAVLAQGDSPPTPVQRGCTLCVPVSGPLELTAEKPGSLSLLAVVERYGELSGQLVLLDDATRTWLERPSGLPDRVELDAGQVQGWLEQMLAAHDCALVVVREEAPRIVRVRSLEAGTAAVRGIRQSALFVSGKDIPHFAMHPATIVTTSVDLPNTDVRQLSTSLRALMTDNNTQNITPAGQSNSLVVTGFGANVAGMVGLLHEIDRASERRPTTEFAVFPLKNAAAPKLASVLASAVRVEPAADGALRRDDPRIVADAASNSLVVVAPPQVMDGLRELIAELDVPPPPR